MNSVWSASPAGRFTVSSIVKFVGPESGISVVVKHVWVAGLPIKFSCLVWRLLH